jgi:hypothetical protein
MGKLSKAMKKQENDYQRRMKAMEIEVGWGLGTGGGCWVLGAGCWVLGAGCWVLGAGCWVLWDVGCVLLDA